MSKQRTVKSVTTNIMLITLLIYFSFGSKNAKMHENIKYV